MTTWTTVHKETREGFDIDLAITPETQDPRTHFELDDVQDIIDGIENCSYEWFTARAQVSRHGVPLGDAYLGCCLYADAREFVADEYWHMLADEAMCEARDKLALFAADVVGKCIKTLDFHGHLDAIPGITWMAASKLGVKR